jgi:predicted metal-dependent HD superfamily phosphohydrolase
MNYQELLDQVQQHVLAFFKTHTDPKLVYHNQAHTERVVVSTVLIANHYQLNEKDFFIANTAAWFHDVGYYIDLKLHEEKGADEAEKFLKNKAIDEDIINNVRSCIMSTKLPQTPTNLIEQIVCDADLFHFGTDNFSTLNKLLRQEYEALKNIPIAKKDWHHETLELLENHQFHTDYCRLLLADKKNENIEKLRRKDSENSEENMPSPIPEGNTEVFKPANTKKKKDKPERGVETMFRISSTNHQRLSDLADNKANILITVNAIIISAVISLLIRRLEENVYLALPTIILLTVSLVTMIYAILATRPSIPQGTFTQSDIDEKKVNLLFFGNFYRMNLDIYSLGMNKMMEDSEFLYGSLIKDIYSQGVVLGRKYRLLRIAYNVFMYGLIIAVVAFVLAAAIHGTD